MFRSTLACAVFAALLATTAHASVLRVGNTSSEVQIGGQGTSGTVVLESGLGDTMDPWRPLLPAINGFSRTFAYNRLGYGRSGPATSNPTPAHVAGQLHDLLVASGLPKPWTLVGHSLGGAYMLEFAKLYPADVGAVVLVDPTPFGQVDVTRQRWPSDYKTILSITRLMGGNANAEFRSFEGAKPSFDALGNFPSVPIYLLESTKVDPSINPDLRSWIHVEHRETVKLSACSTLREVPDSGHYIQRDQPKAVLAAIYEAAHRPHC